MTTYISWVPTVGGRLSYSIIGNSSHPSVAETANVADDKKRRLLCLQHRNLTDSAIPFFKNFFVKLFFDLSSDFVFFLDAACSNTFEDENSLIGTLYLFADDVEQDINGKVLCIREAISKLNSYDNNAPLDVDNFYEDISARYLNNIDAFCINKAKFKLNRDGIIEIDIDAEKNIEHIICAQFYFFIKDISHKHQHHHPKTDTILDIYRKDNVYWPDEILRSLYKKVLDFKRSRNQWVCSSALGVLCYIKEFKKICKRNSIEITVLRDDENLSDSIKIAQDDLRHISSQKVGLRNAILTSLLAILGVMLMLSSLGTLIRPVIEISSSETIIKTIAEWIINSTFNTLIVVTLCSGFISILIYKDYVFGRSNWFKDVTRIFQCFKSQIISGFLMIAFAILIAFIVYRVLQAF